MSCWRPSASTSFVEGRCAKFYAAKYGRPSLTPGIYFRSLLIGYFEGIGAERGIAWRLADSLALRRFVGIGLDENTPDHSTISRTRRLIDLDTHREVFTWVLEVLADRGLLKGQRIAIDATTLEANAAMRSIVRRAPYLCHNLELALCRFCPRISLPAQVSGSRFVACT
jgi:transposase